MLCPPHNLTCLLFFFKNRFCLGLSISCHCIFSFLIRIEQLYQKVLALWHRSHVNMKSVVSWHYLMIDIRNIRKSTVASVSFYFYYYSA